MRVQKNENFNKNDRSGGKFFAFLNRIKYIERWGLMRRIRSENLAEHTLETFYIAHALAIIHNERCGGEVNVERCAVGAAYHDAPEILTGDMPTPVKYENTLIKAAYKTVEQSAGERLFDSVPGYMKKYYELYLLKSEKYLTEKKIIKAADKISALIKCCEELSLGNSEFASAKTAQTEAIKALGLPAAEIFLDEYFGHYFNALDELCKEEKNDDGRA